MRDFKWVWICACINDCDLGSLTHTRQRTSHEKLFSFLSPVACEFNKNCLSAEIWLNSRADKIRRNRMRKYRQSIIKCAYVDAREKPLTQANNAANCSTNFHGGSLHVTDWHVSTAIAAYMWWHMSTVVFMFRVCLILTAVLDQYYIVLKTRDICWHLNRFFRLSSKFFSSF